VVLQQDKVTKFGGIHVLEIKSTQQVQLNSTGSVNVRFY